MRRDARLHERVHGRLELGERRRHRHVVSREHVLVVVDHHVLGVVGDAVPLPGAHDALLVVSGGGLQAGAQELVPAACRGDVGQVGQQPLGREQAGGGVALVVLQDVGCLVGVQDHPGGLPDLLEALRLELHGHTGVGGLELLDGLRPGHAHGAVGTLVVPQAQGLRVLRGPDPAGRSDGQERGGDGEQGSSSARCPARRCRAAGIPTCCDHDTRPPCPDERALTTPDRRHNGLLSAGSSMGLRCMRP